MIIPIDTLVAVADGTKCRLFRNRGAEPHVVLHELPEVDIDSHNVGSGTRHRSATANPDRSRLEEDDHASSASALLNRMVLEGKVENLVLIADPRTLGEMRKQFHAATSAILIGEIAKDLTGHSVEAITDALGKAR